MEKIKEILEWKLDLVWYWLEFGPDESQVCFSRRLFRWFWFSSLIFHFLSKKWLQKQKIIPFTLFSLVDWWADFTDSPCRAFFFDTNQRMAECDGLWSFFECKREKTCLFQGAKKSFFFSWSTFHQKSRFHTSFFHNSQTNQKVGGCKVCFRVLKKTESALKSTL